MWWLVLIVVIYEVIQTCLCQFSSLLFTSEIVHGWVSCVLSSIGRDDPHAWVSRHSLFTVNRCHEGQLSVSINTKALVRTADGSGEKNRWSCMMKNRRKEEGKENWEWKTLFLCFLIITIIITFKGAIRDFLQSPHCTANCLQHTHSSGPGAVVCKSRATHQALITCNMSCYVPRGTKGQLSY